jgi:hypothetical protein
VLLKKLKKNINLPRSNYGLGGAIAGKLIDTYNAHDVNNVKNEKIFV